ncbi:MAG: hypothetical protein IVW57_00370, partial [Ktedonobacterales bacterium]|nr:hypothetical protein [Ktedonobacterales bacterium]
MVTGHGVRLLRLKRHAPCDVAPQRQERQQVRMQPLAAVGVAAPAERQGGIRHGCSYSSGSAILSQRRRNRLDRLA